MQFLVSLHSFCHPFSQFKNLHFLKFVCNGGYSFVILYYKNLLSLTLEVVYQLWNFHIFFITLFIYFIRRINKRHCTTLNSWWWCSLGLSGILMSSRISLAGHLVRSRSYIIVCLRVTKTSHKEYRFSLRPKAYLITIRYKWLYNRIFLIVPIVIR